MFYLIFGIALFFIGQTLGWFQLNAQSFSEWWSDKAVFSAVVLGVPTSILFWWMEVCGARNRVSLDSEVHSLICWAHCLSYTDLDIFERNNVYN